MDVKIPTEWNELTHQQLIRVAGTLLDMPEHYRGATLFWDLFTFEWWKPKDWQRLYRLRRLPAYELTPFVGFLFDTKQYLTRWVLSRYRQYYGPDSSMGNVCWQEFITADSLYLKYRETDDEHFLHLLTATLFRLPGDGPRHNPEHLAYDGDRRREFNQHIPDRHIKRISKWPEAVHHAVRMNYEGIRRKLEQDYDRVFNQEEEPVVHDGPKGWEPVTMELSGKGLGDFKDVQRQPFRKVLLKLDINARQVEKINDRNES